MFTSNIRNLERDACSVFAEHGYSEHTIKPMLFIMRAITRLHIERGEEHFNAEIADNYIKKHEERYQNGEIAKYAFYFYRNTVERLSQIYETGTITIKRYTPRPELPECLGHLLADMFADEKWVSELGKVKYRHIRTFLDWLYSHGHNDLCGVDGKVVGEYLADCSARMVGSSLYGLRKSLKDFLLFVITDSTVSALSTPLQPKTTSQP